MTPPEPGPDSPRQGPADNDTRRLRDRLSSLALDVRPLRNTVYRRTFLGESTAVLGVMITEVAVPVQIYDITKSSFAVGLAGLVGLLPLVFFGLYGGAVADTMDRRLVYLASSLLTWAATVVLVAQAVLDLRSVGLILTLVAVQTAGFAVSSSLSGAIIPSLVSVDQIPAANTLTYTASTAGQILGPLVAGVLVGVPHGFALAYGADAVLFTAAVYAIFRLPRLPPSGESRRAGARDVLAGLAFIVTRPVLLVSFSVDIAAMVLAMPRALFPQAAADRFHGGISLLYSAIAVGSIVAGLGSGWIGRVRRQGRALTFAVLGWSAAVAIAGVVHHLWLVFGLLMLAGAADLVSAVCRQTILQTYAPEEMRGRMQGVHTVVVDGGPRLGDLRAGTLAATTTLSIAWSGSAVVCLVLVTVVAFAARSFWRYEPAVDEQ
ncbi:MAG: MFS transporter [Mycobacterium sp.]